MFACACFAIYIARPQPLTASRDTDKRSAKEGKGEGDHSKFTTQDSGRVLGTSVVELRPRHDRGIHGRAHLVGLRPLRPDASYQTNGIHDSHGNLWMIRNASTASRVIYQTLLLKHQKLDK